VSITTSDGTPTGTPTGLALSTMSSGIFLPIAVPFAPLSGPPLLTVNDLAGAVNAITGWTAVVTPGMGLCPLTELRPTTGGLGAVGRPAQLLAYTTELGDYELIYATGKITVRLIRPDPYSYPTRTYGAWSPVTKMRVVYTAGYNGDPTQGPVTTPGDLAEGCIEVAKGMLDSRLVSGAFKEVVLGNTSWQAGAPVAIPDSAKGLFSKYVNRRV
jgi:hypothetical protein